MNLENKYWHCFISQKGISKIRHVSDLTYEQIKNLIIDPYKTDKPIVFKDFTIPIKSNIVEISIIHTNVEISKIPIEDEEIYDRASGNYMPNNRSLLDRVRKNGSDYTDYLLKNQKDKPDSIDTIISICDRIKYSCKSITHRTRDGKISYTISDEYDVQDLLQMVIKSYFPYSIQEDPIGKIAGVKSSRIDIAIENLGVLIEIKYARSESDQEKFLTDFSKDLLLYSKWPNLKYFIFFIYNSHFLKDKDEFQRLSGEKKVFENVEIVL
ncbi:hypothetical protein [Leptospira harrisiae]|uniref:PD-(D/E)XK nuclease domain-containing protein n=1 Tax=Leptospira harrisiae TaxID=2023189 RepID=UPI000C2A69CB|nr:hypothetical protein [Leptospira harrisiae]PKA06420.1 hypothetical protein CH366_19235 [Leptospira harrisiae]